MTPTSHLTDLLRWCEEAEGPSREIDGRIEVQARRVEAAHVGLSPEHWARWESDACGLVRDPHTIYGSASVTASLDAALELVERVLPGFLWEIGCASPPGHWARLYENPMDVPQASAASTPALALICALLRALLAATPKEEAHHG